MQQAWTPRDLAEGGKAGRAGSGLFAGLKLRRRPAAEQAGVPEAIQEEPEEEEEGAGEAAQARQGPGSGQPEQELTSSIPQRGPSALIVGWEHLKEEPEVPLSPRELEERRLEFERYKARNLLFDGSILGVNWDDEDSSDSDVEMGSTGGEREDESQDAMVMSGEPSTIGRFGSFFFRFGGFGRGGSNS